jgi:ankyrin repeat protein
MVVIIPAHIYAMLGATAYLEELTPESLHEENENGWNALHFATAMDMEVTVNYCLDHGFSINQSTKLLNISPMMMASCRGFNDIVRLFLGRGADITTKCPNGVTALMLASTNGHEETARLLLLSTAKWTSENDVFDYINSQDKDGNTAFMMAVNAGYYKVAKLLLEFHADPIISSLIIGSPRSVASKYVASKPQLVDLIDSWDRKYTLTKLRYIQDSASEHRIYFLHYREDSSIFKKLWQLLTVDIDDNNVSTILQYAISLNDNMFGELLEFL